MILGIKLIFLNIFFKTDISFKIFNFFLKLKKYIN
jgi:hypothetical protein